MDDLIEAAIELAGELLEILLKGIKNSQKRKWALTIFYSVATLVIAGLLIWGAVAIYTADGNRVGATVFATMAGAILVVFGFFILRGHKSNWVGKKQE